MYKIYADSCCDLPLEVIEKINIGIIPLRYTIDGVEHVDDRKDDSIFVDFYDKMKKGAMTSTSQPTPEELNELFTGSAEAGEGIIYIALSSAISGSYNTACMMMQACKEKYPDAQIAVVDSLCASGGFGKLVLDVVARRDEGFSFEEIVDWAEENKLHYIHWFTVDDLDFLYRGGRVSKISAKIGGILHLKPVLHVDNQGRLIKVGVARGRKAALAQLVKNTIEDIQNSRICAGKKQSVTVLHANCPEDAKYCADELKKCPQISSVEINYIGPTIGSHSGPGTLAIFSFADSREKKES